jgi:subtilisin family serine protease
MQTRILAAATLCALAVGGAQAGQYVLQAGKWGTNQANAVARAGGTVTYANADAGIAVVQSDNANFLASALGSGSITSGAADMTVRFTEPTRAIDAQIGNVEADAGAPVSTANARFYAIQWAPKSVDAPAAWAAGYTGAGVRVAVIDGGIFDGHPDLAGAIDVAASTSFVAPSGPTDTCSAKFNCDTASFWHGTHVAGIIAARGKSGVMGIAPGATIVGVKALQNGTGSFGAIISAVIYAATQGRADIINMSLGAEFGRCEDGAAELRWALNREMNFAKSRGSLVVVAAGNSAIDYDHPASFVCDPTTTPVTMCPADLTDTPAESGNAIAISATGPLDFAHGAMDFTRPASYSNYGNSLVWMAGPGGDAALPGTAVCTVRLSATTATTNFCWVFDMVLSTTSTGWSWAAGTSMATPAVAAVAALVKEQNPMFAAAQLKNRLAQSAVDEGKAGQDNFYGRGYVNARRALGL